MGNFSSKDSHGPTGSHGESFHTPPASPQSDGPVFTPGGSHLLHHSSPKPSHAAPVSSPPPVPVATSTWKKPQPSTTPSTPCTSSPAPNWRPQAPVSSNGTTVGPAADAVPNKPGTTAVRGQSALGRNGGPPTSTPRTLVSQERMVAVSPTKCPTSLCSSSPVGGSSSAQNWRERDSGLSQSLLPGHEAGDSHSEELEKLLEDCRSTLAVTTAHDGALNATEVLRRLLSEVKDLRSALQTERGEWLQFQHDLQVAVSVADRLRAEAEDELMALRTVHDDTKRELAVVQQRQKEADMQLVTLRGELTESKQRLATLNHAEGKTDSQAPCQESERPNGDSTNSSDSKITRRGRERTLYRLGREGPESSSQNETATMNVASKEARTDCRSVTKRYLRNVTNEDRSGDEVPKTVTTERSRSLSRLPAASDSPTIQNGTSQLSTAATLGSTKNLGQLRGRRSLDWLDGRSSIDTGKREESLNKYNSALNEFPPTKSQDGFNLLLRRHGGSKRNSLLRWCQNQTQGYKNIDITNFSSSWADGLAFCAVYHSYLPSHIPYNALFPENKRENLSLAFKTGESVGIAQTLTLEEMLRAGGPDWQRVLNYVESMYRHFEM